MWERVSKVRRCIQVQVQSPWQWLAFMGSAVFHHPQSFGQCFPPAKAFGDVRMKPELLPALPRRVVGWVYAPIVFAQTSINLS